MADHLHSIGVDATVDLGDHDGVYRIRRRVTDRPTVSVVIPTRGSTGRVWGRTRIFVHDAVASLVAADGGAVRLEFVVVLDEPADPVVVRGLRRIAGDALVVVPYDKPFDFADKIDVGVAAASGEYVLLLNDDTELHTPGSIDQMVGLAQQRDVVDSIRTDALACCIGEMFCAILRQPRSPQARTIHSCGVAPSDDQI
mgnify:CR=1 FL=1